MSDVQLGLMMDFPLTTQHFLWRMRNVHPTTGIVSVTDGDGTCSGSSFAEAAHRSLALAASLARFGVRPGDRIGTFAFNSAAHLEAYLGVMSMGAVLHTINVRVHDSQLVWMVNHAQDRVIFVDADLTGRFLPLLSQMPSVHAVVIIGEVPRTIDVPSGVQAMAFDDFASADPADYRFPDLDERAAAALCYTSGTTGDPKGVLYSHRSIAIHALIMTGSDVFAVRNDDTVLATVPMFHAMGWGLPFVSIISGARLVMPGRHLDPRSLHRVIRDEDVTWSSGVPTVWTDLLRYVSTAEEDAAPSDLKSLRKLILGGAQVPGDLIRRFANEVGTTVVSGWGMTEIFPGATVANVDSRKTDGENFARQATAGRVSPFYEIRLVDDEGTVVPHDGVSRGEIEVRGPAVASDYFRLGDSAAEEFDHGWLRTGDIGTVSPDGWVTVVDRSKDMIKSGGEWISSADLESALLEHPSIHEAAVVGRPDLRWSERPYAFVVAEPELCLTELRTFLEERVPSWWVPDQTEVTPSLPRTSTGKVDKKQLRDAVAVGR
ncbi:long-chain-fatty-acid--CoA ligase [Mycobacterium sp. SVM_VP21]|nr:long-chain-fatty-acid--CoA ligase [Mycobacterium sp. SVM_VP21]